MTFPVIVDSMIARNLSDSSNSCCFSRSTFSFVWIVSLLPVVCDMFLYSKGVQLDLIQFRSRSVVESLKTFTCRLPRTKTESAWVSVENTSQELFLEDFLYYAIGIIQIRTYRVSFSRCIHYSEMTSSLEVEGKSSVFGF
jgi:hypothetical protein